VTALLEVSGISKSFFGVKAVSDVSLAVESGELLALIGPNGAGKSTCFNMLNGQLRPDQGTIRLKGEDITGRSPRLIWRLGVGRTFQIAATFNSMTVEQNVQMALISHAGMVGSVGQFAGHYKRAETNNLLQLVGMDQHAHRAAAELAYGDVKRLELAMALSNDPCLLLMDEPTAGMSPMDRVELMALTARIAKSRNIGVLFTEHDMDVVFQHADRIEVLARGSILASGTPDEVRQNPTVKSIYLGEGRTYADVGH
jgi:branched-chain amino acid transport system ATP-binding protein